MNPDRWVDEHGDALLRYAVARIGDVASAEDLLHETFIITCREAARLISESLDTPLPVWRRVLVGLHLCVCRMCRNYLRQMRMVRGTIAVGLRDPDRDGAFPSIWKGKQ